MLTQETLVLNKTTALDSKTALADKTQKNKRALVWVDFRDMGWFLMMVGEIAR
jgi:hypothetical protein